MKMTKLWWCWLLMCLLVACGSADEGESEAMVSSTLDTDVDDARADAPGTWQVKTPGLTMWVGTVLEPHPVKGDTRWTLRGRVSKTMTGFRAYTASGSAFAGQMVSARKFEVVLTSSEVLDIVAGERVYFDFFAKRGADPMYHGMVQFAARFNNWAGTSSIYVYRAVNPVIVGDNVKFRGRASTRSGFELDVVYTDDDADPALFDDAPNKYHFDWTPAALHLAADPPEDPVRFRGSDAAQTPVEKSASLEFRLVQMGLGTKSPVAAWPPPRCEPQVRQCLRDLETGDTEACGWANEVRPCREAVALPLAADAARFTADLREAIRIWYADHEDDVRALNGRTLDAALRAVDEERVGQLDAAEVDELSYDPAHFDAFFHADPVFRGSDRVWYGVYDHGGTLIWIEAIP